jgi:hypothetical protein
VNFGRNVVHSLICHPHYRRINLMSVQTRDHRLKLLEQWAVNMAHAAAAGALTGGKPLTIRALETVRGPRAGALEIDAASTRQVAPHPDRRRLRAAPAVRHLVVTAIPGKWPALRAHGSRLAMRWPKKTSP